MSSNQEFFATEPTRSELHVCGGLCGAVVKQYITVSWDGDTKRTVSESYCHRCGKSKRVVVTDTETQGEVA